MHDRVRDSNRNNVCEYAHEHVQACLLAVWSLLR